ncbi:glycerol-3-phosphate transporter periplasmic binding protein [Hafnia alvei]|uniref:Glycerol-3-phosphate transporter periplasmic binding protein n=1 Tax=Hafnia alvei TaxID=569 RepID=A0A377PR57_HAFAL|nr:glycerol-3-phosphate transporter periplasmic binding protein [Hafnia alvei]
MEAELGTEVDSLAQRFNQSQNEYKVVPVYKGDYEQSLAAGIAAFRAGKAPAILQVYEVGTATMMQAKQAIKPVYQVFKEAGIPFDESSLFQPSQAITPIILLGNFFLSRSIVQRRFSTTTKTLLKRRV